MVNGKQFFVYVDSGYSLHMYLEVPFAVANLSAIQEAFKKAISTVRIIAEWFFKCFKLLWSFMESKRNLRVRDAGGAGISSGGVSYKLAKLCLAGHSIAVLPVNIAVMEEYVSTRTDEKLKQERRRKACTGDDSLTRRFSKGRLD